MKQFLKAARRVALCSATVLLIGQSGVGKTVFARQMHLWSRRREQSFISVNCRTLSELGIERRMLDNAAQVLLALRRCAESRDVRLGTIFFDNLADMDRAGQAALLEFIESQRHDVAASQDSETFGPRIIAASNRELASDVAANKFRADLFYRVSAVSLRIPALRERSEDILPLAEHLLRAESNAVSRPGLQFTEDAELAIRHRPWHGNVRELRNAIKRAVIVSGRDSLNAEDLLEAAPAHPSGDEARGPMTKLRDLEKNHIARVLASCATFQEAAAALGINSATLWRKRRLYKLD